MFSLISAASALLLASTSPASEWNGSYTYTHDGGRTAGGSPILVTWRLTLKDGACAFAGEGFQTKEAFNCTLNPSPQGLEVRFLSYPPPSTGDRFGVEVYKPGTSLFVLSKAGGKLLTRWTGFVPDEGVTRSPAAYFQKVR
ncbi:MAG: DUF5991 domain-containing protein [Caulobacter sp.]